MLTLIFPSLPLSLFLTPYLAHYLYPSLFFFLSLSLSLSLFLTFPHSLSLSITFCSLCDIPCPQSIGLTILVYLHIAHTIIKHTLIHTYKHTHTHILTQHSHTTPQLCVYNKSVLISE